MYNFVAVCHDVKCGVCKQRPVIGLRYQCLRCLGYNLCQDCFLHARTSRSHKLSHPIQEYCHEVLTIFFSEQSFVLRNFTREICYKSPVKADCGICTDGGSLCLDFWYLVCLFVLFCCSSNTTLVYQTNSKEWRRALMKILKHRLKGGGGGNKQRYLAIPSSPDHNGEEWVVVSCTVSQ